MRQYGGAAKHLHIVVLLAIIMLLPSVGKAQEYVRTDFKSKSYVDTTARMVWTGVNISGQIPVGALRETFKANLSVGTGVTYKTQTNWTFDVNFNYMFGGNLRDTTYSFLGSMLNDDGIIYDGNGMKATIYTEGRYWYVGAGIGKIIPVDRWKNSGIWLHFGAGYFGHKIRINDYDHQVPQLDGDYLKGYDHRSSGFAMNQFIGYLFMQKNRVLSFYGGIEIFESWTKPNRNYIFNEGPTENMPYKFSGLISLKIGWVVPLYEKKETVTFYYR